MEGATLGLRYGFDVMERNGISAGEVIIVGGGAKSGVWRQLAADVFDCPVIGLADGEAGAIGAALQALWCVESEAAATGVSLEDITRDFVVLDEASRCLPRPDSVRFYREQYDRYRELDGCLSRLYAPPLTVAAQGGTSSLRRP
jgi:xylulokinase